MFRSRITPNGWGSHKAIRDATSCQQTGFLDSAVTTSNNYCIILLDSSSNNTLTNNTASYNANYDFYFGEDSHSNKIKDLAISRYSITISFIYDNGIEIKSVTTPEPDPAGMVNISKYVNATKVTAD